MMDEKKMLLGQLCDAIDRLCSVYYETDEDVLARLDDVRIWAVAEKDKVSAEYKAFQQQEQVGQSAPEPAPAKPQEQPEASTPEATDPKQDADSGSNLVDTVLKAAGSSEGQKIIKGLFSKILK